MGVVTILTVPMMVAGKVVGVIGIRFSKQRVFDDGEMDLAQSFANQAMLAMQINRLHAQSRESAVMAERNRMARDIHDTLAQGFTGVIVQLEAAKGGISRGDRANVLKRIGLAGDLARSSLAEARRSVRALRPLSLRDGTLSMALEDLLGRATNGTGIRTEFVAEGSQLPIPDDWEEAFLRIAQESITNTIKHAGAGNIRASLAYRAEGLTLQMTDDGAGFDAATLANDGFGLIGMRERVERLNGTFALRSKPGQGTEIHVFLKYPSSPEKGGGL
jgi:signal transduction histidine kinase